MKTYFLIFTTAVAFAGCDVRRNDKISDDIGIKEDKERRQLSHEKEVAMKDSTTVQLIDSVYNFGSIKAGEKVEYSFKFKNTGNKALVVTDAHASCGCTVPEKPEKPVLPGEIGVIKVVFNSQGKQGHQEKAIMVNSNVKPTFGDLKLIGDVK